MNMFLSIFIFIFGLIIGSFLNVCIYRIPKNISIVKPRSKCTNCDTTLSPLDLVPVLSYFFLGGKCRYCKNKISPRYAIVEFITGLSFVLIYVNYDITLEFFLLIYLISILIIAFFIDIDEMIIPNRLVVAGLVGGILTFIIHVLNGYSIMPGNEWWQPLLGMVSASLILFIIALIGLAIYGGDGGIGMGDVKILIPIGMVLGWKLAILSLLLSVFIGGFVGIILIISGLRKRNSQIPYGPFIVLGTFISILYGYNIIDWYLSQFTI